MDRTKKAVVAVALGALALVGTTAAPQQSDSVVAMDRKCC